MHNIALQQEYLDNVLIVPHLSRTAYWPSTMSQPSIEFDLYQSLFCVCRITEVIIMARTRARSRFVCFFEERSRHSCGRAVSYLICYHASYLPTPGVPECMSLLVASRVDGAACAGRANLLLLLSARILDSIPGQRSRGRKGGGLSSGRTVQ